MLQALGGWRVQFPGLAGGVELGLPGVRRPSASGGTAAKNGVGLLESGGLYCNDWRKVVRGVAGHDRSSRSARRARMTAFSLNRTTVPVTAPAVLGRLQPQPAWD